MGVWKPGSVIGEIRLLMSAGSYCDELSIFTEEGDVDPEDCLDSFAPEGLRPVDAKSSGVGVLSELL